MKLFLSFVLLLAPIPALAGDPAAGDLSTTFTETQEASADLVGGDGGCITTSANIFVTRLRGSTSQSSPVVVRRIFVRNMTRMNTCTGALELSVNGSGPVENFFFWDSGASVGALLQLTNTVTGAVVPVRVDLVWTASGEKTDYRNETLRTRPDGTWDTESNFGMTVLSFTTGSVTDGAFQYALTSPSAYIAKNTRKTKTPITN